MVKRIIQWLEVSVAISELYVELASYHCLVEQYSSMSCCVTDIHANANSYRSCLSTISTSYRLHHETASRLRKNNYITLLYKIPKASVWFRCT